MLPPPIDPTANVIALVHAEALAAARLREADIKFNDARIVQVETLIRLHAHHQRELDAAESARLNAIRQVDREEVTKTAAQALTAIQTLAATTTTTAETLRTQVAATATATATQLATISGEINKRLSALELSSSERTGKQTLADPMMEQLMRRMDSLIETRAGSAGKSAGVSWVAYAAVGAVTLVGTIVGILGTLAGIAGVLYTVLAK